MRGMTDISADAHARGEAARVRGRFGEQERTAEEVSLAGASTSRSCLENQVDLRDIRSMGGDEIDALDDIEAESAARRKLGVAGTTRSDTEFCNYLRYDLRENPLRGSRGVRERPGTGSQVRSGASGGVAAGRG